MVARSKAFHQACGSGSAMNFPDGADDFDRSVMSGLTKSAMAEKMAVRFRQPSPRQEERMVDISALMNALPVSGLEPQLIGLLNGLIPKSPDEYCEPSIELVEPPAGRHVPFVNPIKILTIFFRRGGMDRREAINSAEAKYQELKNTLTASSQVVFYKYLNPVCDEWIPANEMLNYLRKEKITSDAVIEFIDAAVETIICQTEFYNPENWEKSWSLIDRPQIPSPMEMIEFYPASMSYNLSKNDDDYCEQLKSWYGEIRPIAERLERLLKEPVYYFGNPDSDIDDDACHRFIAIYCCCYQAPQSPFVNYMVEVSGARDVNELKNALINPESYFHPFKMNSGYRNTDATLSRFRFNE